VINYHLGQAWLTWQLSRIYCGKAQLWRATGATLLCYASVFGGLIALAAVSLVLAPGRFPWLLPIVVAIAAIGVVYLIVIKQRPSILARRQVTAPLLQAGVRGHLLAVLHRLPHIVVLLVGTWLPFRFFGVDVPLRDALALLPPVLIVAALPITPQGVGTRDAVALQLFTAYATGTQAERASAVAAATLTWAIALTLIQIPLSLFLMRHAKRSSNRTG
jgi:hypothetical protein